MDSFSAHTYPEYKQKSEINIASDFPEKHGCPAKSSRFERSIFIVVILPYQSDLNPGNGISADAY